MIDFLKVLSETKTQLQGMLTKDSSPEQIKVISEMDKKLDSLNEAFTEKTQENESLKNSLIEAVKNTGFKVSNSQTDDSGVDQNQKSMDEIMSEELSKIVAAQK